MHAAASQYHSHAYYVTLARRCLRINVEATIAPARVLVVYIYSYEYLLMITQVRIRIILSYTSNYKQLLTVRFQTRTRVLVLSIDCVTKREDSHQQQPCNSFTFHDKTLRHFHYVRLTRRLCERGSNYNFSNSLTE